MRKLAVLFALIALVPFALAACGGDDDEETTAETTEETTADDGGGGETVAVSADPGGALAFEQSSLTAAAGAATFEFTNDADLPHDFCLEQDGSDLGCSDTVSGGESTTLDAELEAGEFVYYCSVAGHRDGGMEGTLTVE